VSGLSAAVARETLPSRPRRASQAAAVERPLIRLATFGALALYGVLRWGTMLSPAPTWRLLGMLACALLLVALGTIAPARRQVNVIATRKREHPRQPDEQSADIVSPPGYNVDYSLLAGYSQAK